MAGEEFLKLFEHILSKFLVFGFIFENLQ